jgi:hypothetical protein
LIFWPKSQNSVIHEINKAFKLKETTVEKMRKISKPAAILLAFHMLILPGLNQSVWAAMISTESIINVDRTKNPRDYLNNILAREEIQAVLISHGINPQEARDRIDNLSEDEIRNFVHEIDRLPAGGGGGLGVFTLSLIVVLLVIYDMFFLHPATK